MQESVFELPRKIPIFSLQKMCLLKLSSIVCNNEEVLDLILKCHYYEFTFERFGLQKTKIWKAAQNKANEIISRICSSTIIQEKIKELFWPMSYRIIMWKHTYAPCFTHKHLRRIVWTDVGKINTIATAKYIIENKEIDIRKRFILACKLCLTEEIHEIWLEMSDKDKRYYSTKYREIYRPLLVFWVYAMLESDGLYSCFSAYQCAIQNNLWDAVKSLFSTLKKYEIDPGEKDGLEMVCFLTLEEKLRQTEILEENENEICCFLFSQIEWTAEKREVINNDCRLLSLSHLFHSSQYEKFINAIQSEVDFLKVHSMLQMVFNFYDLEITYEDNDYQKLFIDIWRALPTQTKINIGTETDLGATCVIDLIAHGFPFVLKAKGYKKINALPISDLNCSALKTPLGFHHEKWNFLQFLIREEVAPMSSLEEKLKSYTSKLEFKRVSRFLKKIRQQSLWQDPQNTVEPPVSKSI